MTVEPATLGPAEHVVGIDLGGTKIHAGLATVEGMIVVEKRVATESTGAGIARQLESLVAELCAHAGVAAESVVATGIGGAGVPDESGSTFDLAPNLGGLGQEPFVSELEARLGHPVVLDNDVNVAAIGELNHGFGRVHDDFVFVSVGTGIGMGVVINGSLVRGSSGAAGEIGYLPFGADPLDPGNHVRGALEEAVAGDAIVRRYADASGQRVGAEEIFARAAAGDPGAESAVDVEAHWVARALVAVKAVLDPGVVVLGGGIGSRPDLIPRLHRWLALHGTTLDLRLSELGHRAPVLGAIHLALEARELLQKGEPR